MDDDKLISVELRSLSNMTMRYMDSHGHKNYLDSVTGRNGWIIGYIASRRDEDVFQRDIEKTFGITRSTVSKVINLMERKGFIERAPVDYDSRLKKLTLTEKSRKFAAYMHEDSVSMENVLTDGFTDEDKRRLMQYIVRMKGNLRGIPDVPLVPRGEVEIEDENE